MKRSTKTSLLMSVVAMLLSVSMLMGSTFAWFTDSVTATNNVIVSGNLDVELYYQNDVTGNTWKPVDSNSNIFKADTLWEPGHVEVIELKVVNAGTLALKYQLGINIVNEIGSTNVEGAPFKLSDFIKFGIVEGDTDFNRAEAVAAVESTAKLLKDAYTSDIIDLLPLNSANTDNNDIVTVVVYMPESVGNEANYRGSSVPTINLGINLLATQYTYEKDSFDEKYDKDANVVATVASLDEFTEALSFAKDGDTIALANDITDTDGLLLTDRVLTIDLNGKTLTVSEGSSINNRNLKINGSSNVTIKNGTLVAGGNMTSGSYGAIRTEGTANVTLDNVKLYNYRGNGFNVKALGNSTVTINDSEIYSQYGGGVEAAGGTIELNNVTINQQGVYSAADWNSVPIGVNGGGTVIVNSGNYYASTIATDANAPEGNWVAYVMSSGGNLIINGGNFEAVVSNTAAASNACGIICADRAAVVEINGGNFTSNGAILDMRNNPGTAPNPVATLKGGSFSADPRVSGLYSSNLIKVAEGYVVNENTADGTWSVDRDYSPVASTGDKVANGAALGNSTLR